MGQRIDPQIPAEYAGYGEMEAAFIVNWWADNPRARGIVSSYNDWEAFSIEQFQDAASVVWAWQQDALACSGAYAGDEDGELVEAAEWLAQRTARLRQIDKLVADLQQEKRLILTELGISVAGSGDSSPQL